jgi:ankyrin repeat protein
MNWASTLPASARNFPNQIVQTAHMSQSKLLTAIEHDDRRAIKSLLGADLSLATLPIRCPKLYWGKISHWIYAGDTPLHLAAAGYRVEIVPLLLASGADPNSTLNHRQSAPLHYAADTCLRSKAWSATKQVETIRCLLQAGAKINAPDKNGATPLHRAVRTRGVDAVRCLLNAGCDPLLRNKPGSTPFHLAVQNTGRGGSGTDAAKSAQRAIIEHFLSIGLSASLKDARGKTVLESARSCWIRELLGGQESSCR